MIIGQIKDGIVLDHITAGRALEIYDVLELGKLDCWVALIQNVDSKKKGKKDIIKIGKVIDLDFTVLGFMDPGITVNIISDGKLLKRSHLTLPQKITGIFRCKNPRCISSTEQELTQEFKLTDAENKTYRCIYCESEIKTK